MVMVQDVFRLQQLRDHWYRAFLNKIEYSLSFRWIEEVFFLPLNVVLALARSYWYENVAEVSLTAIDDSNSTPNCNGLFDFWWK
jgi:hypothetical protein